MRNESHPFATFALDAPRPGNARLGDGEQRFLADQADLKASIQTLAHFAKGEETGAVMPLSSTDLVPGDGMTSPEWR